MKRVCTDQITLANGSTSIAIASTAVVYTKAFKVGFGEYFALSYKAVSASGSPDIKIELEQGIDVPTTEGSADSAWVVPENMANIETKLTTETQHHKSISPVPMLWARLKITGNDANPADTIVTAYISKQEEF